QASDVLLLPSKREGFSLVCLEAMSVGVPHVRTRTSGFSETLGLSTQSPASPGLAGWCSTIDNADFVATAKQVLNDPGGLRFRGERAAQLVREHFTYEQQLAGTIALYRQLVGQRVAGGAAYVGDAT
ncbi:MAG: glycosyltransferase, partial [Planctomycetota bacterium]